MTTFEALLRRRWFRLMPAYCMAGVLGWVAAEQARNDWPSAWQLLVGMAVYVVSMAHVTDNQRTLHYRSGYARGTLLALVWARELSRGRPGTPPPTPDHVHPDDPRERVEELL